MYLGCHPCAPSPCASSAGVSSSSLCAAGDSGPPVLLIHGFGASAYHWRYQVPSLARNHRVYAIDLLGMHTSLSLARLTAPGSELDRKGSFHAVMGCIAQPIYDRFSA